MRVLLDENLPHNLIEPLSKHDVSTVQGGHIDAFVTMDRKLQHEQRFSRGGLMIAPAAAGYKRRLTTNSNHLTWRQSGERLQNPRHEWPQFFNAVRPSNGDDYAHTGYLQVLLKLEILVDRQKGHEMLGDHQTQQFAVAFR